MKQTTFLCLGLFGAIAIGESAIGESAIAHGVSIQTQLSSRVEVIGRYEDGQPLKHAQVKVFSPSNPAQPQFTGQTDEKGRYFFNPTEPGEWEIFIRQAGHGGQTTLAFNENVAAPDRGLSLAKTSTGLSWPQRLLMIGAVLWGCVGTALYFKGRSA